MKLVVTPPIRCVQAVYLQQQTHLYNTINLSIQNDEVVPNQVTEPRRQGTRVRQPTKCAAEAEAQAEASRKHKLGKA